MYELGIIAVIFTMLCLTLIVCVIVYKPKYGEQLKKKDERIDSLYEENEEKNSHIKKLVMKVKDYERIHKFIDQHPIGKAILDMKLEKDLSSALGAKTLYVNYEVMRDIEREFTSQYIPLSGVYPTMIFGLTVKYTSGKMRVEQ